ncbi:Endoplasmic reticulum lectin 1 [Hondaea fermentalgiana]|uniref:Endoplasmic reticulum lectin 1 n=1 Tax=Hondaea fermentalgiana TaxID=2315210 RepID=A0A2R5GXM1_9STRA|nr:Endoplasmic reticulum lectin 1 [Hondaea fermentalgiana]|eukprot:GBG32714.1 Endoplasmic reticulum lectin 1 [Hondaea fermentalgiana]
MREDAGALDASAGGTGILHQEGGAPQTQQRRRRGQEIETDDFHAEADEDLTEDAEELTQNHVSSGGGGGGGGEFQKRMQDEKVRQQVQRPGSGALFHSANCLRDHGLMRSVARLEQEIDLKGGVAARRQLKTVEQLQRTALAQVDACLHADRNWCASLGSDGVISVWDYAIGRCIHRFVTKQSGAGSAARGLFFHGQDRVVAIFDTFFAICNQLIGQLPKLHRTGITALVASTPREAMRSGTRAFEVATGSAEGSLVLWRVQVRSSGTRKPGAVDLLDRSGWLDLEGSGRLTLSARDDVAHPGGVISLRVDSTQETLLSFGRDLVLVLWDLNGHKDSSAVATARRRWTLLGDIDPDAAQFLFMRMSTSSLPDGALLGCPLRDGELYGYADAGEVSDILSGGRCASPNLERRPEGTAAPAIRELLRLQRVGSLWAGLKPGVDSSSLPLIRRLVQHPREPDVVCAISDHGVHIVRCEVEPQLRACASIPGCGRVAFFMHEQRLKAARISVETLEAPQNASPSSADFDTGTLCSHLSSMASPQPFGVRSGPRTLQWPGTPQVHVFARVKSCLVAVVWPSVERYIVLSMTSTQQNDKDFFADGESDGQTDDENDTREPNWHVSMVDQGIGSSAAWSWTPREVILGDDDTPTRLQEPGLATLVTGVETRYRAQASDRGAEDGTVEPKSRSFRARKRMASLMTRPSSTSIDKGPTASASGPGTVAVKSPPAAAAAAAAAASSGVGGGGGGVSAGGSEDHGLQIRRSPSVGSDGQGPKNFSMTRITSPGSGAGSPRHSARLISQQKHAAVPVGPPHLCLTKFTLSGEHVTVEGRQIALLACDPIALHGGGPALLVSFGNVSPRTSLSERPNTGTQSAGDEPHTPGDMDSMGASVDSDSTVTGRTSAQALAGGTEGLDRDRMLAFKSRFFYWTTLPAALSDRDAAAVEIEGAQELIFVKLRPCGDEIETPSLVQWSCMGSATPFTLEPSLSSLTCALAYGPRVEMLTLTTTAGVQASKASFRWQGSASAGKTVEEIEWFNGTLLVRTRDDVRVVYWAARNPKDAVPLAHVRSTLNTFREKALNQKDRRSALTSGTRLASMRLRQSKASTSTTAGGGPMDKDAQEVLWMPALLPHERATVRGCDMEILTNAVPYPRAATALATVHRGRVILAQGLGLDGSASIDDAFSRFAFLVSGGFLDAAMAWARRRLGPEEQDRASAFLEARGHVQEAASLAAAAGPPSLAALLMVLLAAIPGTVAQESRAIKPFFVAKDEEAHTVVKLRTKAQTEVSCQLSHVTSSQDPAGAQGGADGGANANNGNGLRGNLAGSPEQQVFQAVHGDVEAMLARLNGICIRKTIEYWKYELCFESKVTQSHGRNAFLLGTYVGMDGVNQLYDEGTRCEALTGNVGRESRVEFVCDDALRLLSVVEVSTCSYMIYVSTPVVCGHPQFQQNLKRVPGISTGSNAGPLRDEWTLELFETADGQVACVAAALDPGSMLNFKSFEISLSVVTPSMELKTAHDMARSRGRQTLSQKENHYEVRRVEDNTRIILASGSAFRGGLTYAVVQGAAQPL